MVKIMKLFNDRIGFPLRRSYLVKHLSPYLKNSKNVLDLGSSCGRLANDLSQNFPDANFVGLDTHIQPKTFIPTKKYDGRHIPFPDNSFDCVMIIDTLHHDENPAAVLKEARRVSKKYILIKDHYWNNKLDFIFLRNIDYFCNKPYGVALPYNFLKISDWEEVIKESSLKIIKSKKLKYNIFYPCKHIIYFLEK